MAFMLLFDYCFINRKQTHQYNLGCSSFISFNFFNKKAFKCLYEFLFYKVSENINLNYLTVLVVLQI